jgi:hypothetical protein
MIMVLLGFALGCGEDQAGPAGPSTPSLVGTWTWIGSEELGKSYDVDGTATFRPDSMLEWSGTVDYHTGGAPLQDVWTHQYSVRADTLTIGPPETGSRWVIGEQGSVLTLSLAGATPPDQVLTLQRLE